MCGDVRCHVEAATLGAPPQARTKVAQLELDEVDGLAPSGAVPALPFRDGAAGELGRVPITGQLLLARFRKTILGELANRLVEAVAGRRRRVIGHDERLAYERIESAKNVDVIGVFGESTRRRQVESAEEDRRASQQRLLVVAEQVVGPGDGVAQRELSLGTGRTAVQQ